MRIAVIFGLCGLALLGLSVPAASWWIRAPGIDFAIVCLLVGAAYALNRPGVFLKRADGRISWLGWLIFWPYFIPNIAALWLFRRRRAASAYNSITDRVWLGCHVGTREAKALLAVPFGAVLDVAAEFSETALLRKLRGYRSLLVLDSGAPSLDELTAGVAYIEREQKTHPIYVHCAMGHGRSAVFILAWLLQSGRANDVADGLRQLRAIRPAVGFSPVQHALLVRFAHELRLSPRADPPRMPS